MKSKTLPMILFASLFGQNNVNAQCASEANIYSFKYGGKTYEVVKELKSWFDAADCAVKRGGYLAEINDVNEQTAIYNGIITAGISTSYTTVDDGGGIAYVWIGATDKQTEGTWLWDGNNDGTGVHFWNGQGQAGTGTGVAVASKYNNWGKENGTGIIMEPDDFLSNQDAGAIALAGWPAGSTALGAAGQWNDIDISNKLYYIIEKEAGAGIKAVDNNNTLKASPNPCNDNLNIETTLNLKGISYQIFDLMGRLVTRDIFENNNTVYVASLNKGFYYLHFNDGQYPRVIKFIKE